MKIPNRILNFLLLGIILFPCIQSQAQQTSNPNLLIVIEDLRPEFITRATMPNLANLMKKGTSLNNHHAVFPTTPSVNAASIVTGSYPTTHGLLNDTMLLSVPDISKTISTSGKKATAHTTDISRYQYGEADLTILWLGANAPNAEIGSKDHLQFLKQIDAQIGTIVKAHKKQKINSNIFITSSGGTMTATKAPHNVADLLIQNRLKADRNSEDVIVRNDTSIFVKDHDRKLIRRIVERLQLTDWVGTIYTQQIRVTHPEGIAPGVLSFQSIYINTDQSPDILIEPAWEETPNAHGIPGTKHKIGVGDAPTSSPYELHIPLIAFGPDIKTKTQSDVPTSNADIAPTILHLLGTDPPETMTGRILHEILKDGPDPEDVKVLRRRHGAEADLDPLIYTLMMTEYSVNDVDYLHETNPQRYWK